MKYRTLGPSGTVVSSQALGTMTFGRESDEALSGAVLEAFLDAGGTFLDTADVYAGTESESILGRWIAAHPTDAAQLVLATKGRFPVGPGANDYGASRRHLRSALDGSLRRLGVDFIDLYQIHAWDPLTPIEETLRFLDDQISAGRIGAYGFSNFTGWQLTKAVHVARAAGYAPPVTLQPQYSLLVRGIEQEIVPAALDAAIGLLPWSPLGGGWLTGKYRRDDTPTGATRLGEHPESGMEAWTPRSTDERTWQILDVVRAVADELGTTQAAVSLAWLDAQPGVTSTILGARNLDQLGQNLAAADLELPPEALARLSEVSTPRADSYPYGKDGTGQRARPITPDAA